MPTLAVSAYFLAILSDPKVFHNGSMIFDDPKEFDDRKCSISKGIFDLNYGL